MKFKKEDLKSAAYGDCNEGFELISKEICDTSRWSIMTEMIFKYDGKFYSTVYSKGATEQQDEAPFQYEQNEIECSEVKPVEKTVIVYVAV